MVSVRQVIRDVCCAWRQCAEAVTPVGLNRSATELKLPAYYANGTNPQRLSTEPLGNYLKALGIFRLVSQGTRLRNFTLTRLSPLACGEVKNARERALVPDVFDPAAGRVGRSEQESAVRAGTLALTHSKDKRKELSALT